MITRCSGSGRHAGLCRPSRTVVAHTWTVRPGVLHAPGRRYAENRPAPLSVSSTVADRSGTSGPRNVRTHPFALTELPFAVYLLSRMPPSPRSPATLGPRLPESPDVPDRSCLGVVKPLFCRDGHTKAELVRRRRRALAERDGSTFALSLCGQRIRRT